MAIFSGRTYCGRWRGRPLAASPDRVVQASRRPTHDEIARLAYAYWEARGCQGGSAVEDWLRAERELVARLKR